MKKLLYLLVCFGFSVSMASPLQDFFKAVEIDAGGLVEERLKAGLDPNTRDAQGQVALFLALRHGSAQVTRVLLADRRTQIDLANEHGETPLMMAALRGDLAMVKQLAAAGARLDFDPPRWTPLHYAASGPSVELVDWLLSQGAAIDAPSPNGTTPVMMAARYGSIDAAELLTRRGASLLARNQRDMDAEAFARSAGRDRLADRLLEARKTYWDPLKREAGQGGSR